MKKITKEEIIEEIERTEKSIAKNKELQEKYPEKDGLKVNCKALEYCYERFKEMLEDYDKVMEVSK